MVNDVNGEIDRKIDRVDVRFVINTRVEKGALSLSLSISPL